MSTRRSYAASIVSNAGVGYEKGVYSPHAGLFIGLT